MARGLGYVLNILVLVYVARFIFHLLSGFIFFAEDSVWANIPQSNMFVYSFIYQCVYLPADCAICVAVLLILVKTKVFDKLLELMSKKKKAEEAAPTEQVEQPAVQAETTTENKD